MEKTDQLERWYGFSKNSISRFWHRFKVIPSLKGKRVLDLGCSVGQLCQIIARAGASKVVGVDIDADAIKFAIKKRDEQAADIRNNIEFLVSDLTDLPSNSFDLAVSKDVFEHVLDLETVLNNLNRVLKPGGQIYAAIGPLYPSPFGFHNRWRYIYPWMKVQVPWLHLIFPKIILVSQWNKHHQKPAKNMKDVVNALGLNMMSFREYLAIIKRSGLKIVSQQINTSGRSGSKLLSFLRRVPVLEDLFTFNLYIVLEKN